VSDFSVNVFEALRRIGSKAPFRFPLLDTYLPTITFFDLSDLVSAPLAPRALCGVTLVPPAGLRATFEIDSRAPGGIILETIAFDAGTPTEWRVVISTVPVFPALTAQSLLNIGGGEVKSEFRAGTSATSISGDILIPTGPGYFNLTGQKWIVPPGSFLQFQKAAAAGTGHCSFIFREQPAAFEEA